MSLRTLFFVPLLLVMAGCPAPEPEAPTAPPPKGPFEPEAHDALEKALEQKSSAALVDVFNRYPKLPSGKEALRRAARMMLGEVKTAATACDEATAKNTLAALAPFTLESPDINDAYDEMQKDIADNHVRCLVAKLDAEMKKSEEAWDWPAAFKVLQSEAAKELDGPTLKQRRLATVARWKTFLDATTRGILAGKITLDDDKAQKLVASTSEGLLPADMSDDVKKWAAPVTGLVVVFHDLKDGAILEPPKKYALAKAAKARPIADVASTDGPTVAKGVGFTAVARGKLDDQVLLLAGEPKGDVLTRLGSVKLVFAEADTVGAPKPKATPKKKK